MEGSNGGVPVERRDGGTHKRYPGSEPPRTYCGKPIGAAAIRLASGAAVTCSGCLDLMPREDGGRA